jgi:hypothetical protein
MVVLLRDGVFRGEPLCMEFSFSPLWEWVWGTTESFDFDFISWKGPFLAFWAHRRGRVRFCYEGRRVRNVTALFPPHPPSPSWIKNLFSLSLSLFFFLARFIVGVTIPTIFRSSFLQSN